MFTTTQKSLLLVLFASVSTCHRFRSPHFGGELDHPKANSFQVRDQEDTTLLRESPVEKMHDNCGALLIKLEEFIAKTRGDNGRRLVLASLPETGNLKTELDLERGRTLGFEDVSETGRDIEKTMKYRGINAVRTASTPDPTKGEIFKENKRNIPKVKSPEKEKTADRKTAETTQESVIFGSVKEALSATEATTNHRPTGEPKARPKLEEIGPDRIIDNPFVSCPVGQNNDPSGRCRPVFP